MKRISQILRETDITQIKGDLIRYVWVDGGEDCTNGHFGDELMGKCALGVLACESGKPELKLDKKNRQVNYDAILKAYDIKDDLYPELQHPKISSDEIGWNFKNQDYNLSSIIIRLNDTFEFTFDQIADFLEVTFDL